MYKAVFGFTTGSVTFRAGDTVPDALPYNAARLKRGLIKEVKIIAVDEVKEAKNNVSKRKSKYTAE